MPNRANDETLAAGGAITLGGGAGIGSLAAAGAYERGKEEGLFLSDQDYYNRFIRPREQALQATAGQGAAGAERGARMAQSSFLQAQGLGGTGIGQRGMDVLTPVFQRAYRRAMEQAQMEAEEKRREAFAERDRARALAGQLVGSASQMEGQIASAVLSSSPVTAGLAPVAGARGAAMGTGYSGLFTQMPALREQKAGPLQTLDFGGGRGIYGEPDTSRTRGGGGSDFYRIYGG